MKAIKLLLATILIAATISSCSNSQEPYYPSLEEIITKYDLWYVDYNRTEGIGDVPFISKAFTLSFLNGRLYANNNIVDIGYTGNGYGIEIGYYDTYKGFLEINHNLDGYYDFDVLEISSTTIKLRDNKNRVTYYLEGYFKNSFDFDQIFYDNIEYFLQEYQAWEKTFVSEEGDFNEFDYENFLAFTPENNTTFYSSKDNAGTPLSAIYWDFIGDYKVFNVEGYKDLKILTLNYDPNGNEEFELSVINDQVISLYHYASGTTYEFTGRGFIQYRKPGKEKESVSNDGRKRTKVIRETVKRKKHLK